MGLDRSAIIVPKILVASDTFPIPPRNGVEGSLARLMVRLAEHFDVSFVLVQGNPPFDDEIERMQSAPGWLGKCYIVPTKKAPLLIAALGELFLMRPVFCAWSYDDQTLRRIFGDDRFDIMWASPVGMVTFYKALERATGDDPVRILSIHDAGYYSHFEMAIEILAGKGHKVYGLVMLLRSLLMPIHERRYLSHMQAVHVQTQLERRRVRWLFGGKAINPRIIVAPNGADEELLDISYSGIDSSDVVFVSGFQYRRRVQQAVWFLEKVWPLVTKRLPNSTLLLVGRLPSAEMTARFQQIPGVRVRGFVPVLADVFRDMSLSVVPIRQTKGIVIRVLDSMAAGVPVVGFKSAMSTIDGFENGVHGIGVDEGDATDFAEKIVSLLEDKSRRAAISKNARNLVATNFRWEHTAEIVESAILELLDERQYARRTDK